MNKKNLVFVLAVIISAGLASGSYGSKATVTSHCATPEHWQFKSGWKKAGGGSLGYLFCIEKGVKINYVCNMPSPFMPIGSRSHWAGMYSFTGFGPLHGGGGGIQNEKLIKYFAAPSIPAPPLTADTTLMLQKFCATHWSKLVKH